MSGKAEVARRVPNAVQTRVRGTWTQEQVNLVRATVARDCTEPELAMFLELAARYQLDPFAKQIYATKMKGKNGQPGRLAIIVGRDGMLVIASRSKDYRGYDSDVIRENDEFQFSRNDNGEPIVKHSYGKLADRGEVVGAWSIVYRDGRRPRYFLAPLEEYVPSNNNDFSPWKKQLSVMIEKCAVSTAHRLAFEITGLVGEEEAAHQLFSEERDVVGADDIEWGEDKEIGARLIQLLPALDEAAPGLYPPKKIQVTLAGKTDGERLDLIAELEREIVKHGGVVPEPVEDVPFDGEGIEDVEVVEEGDGGDEGDAPLGASPLPDDDEDISFGADDPGPETDSPIAA